MTRRKPVPPAPPARESIPFPAPDATIAGRNYWSKGAIGQYLAAITGKPAPEPQPDDQDLLTAKQVRAIFGGASSMWLWRRLNPGRTAKGGADARAA